MNSQNEFSNRSYITTDHYLRRAIGNCQKCNSITLSGSLIVRSDRLPFLILPKHKQKYFIIVHVRETLAGSQIGHWFCCSIFPQSGHCLIIDPSNRIHSYANVDAFIKEFCTKNSLKPLYFNTKFESSSSLICGQLVLFMCYLTSVKSLKQMLEFRSFIRSKPLHIIERYTISFVMRHYKINT